MQVGADQGTLLTLLARAVRARTIVEVGTFTGWSTLCLARGLAEGGRVLTIDRDPEAAALARRTWHEAGVADRIDLHLGEAVEVLAGLPHDMVVDLAFIDADKHRTRSTWRSSPPGLAPHGLVAVDNTLWGGAVAGDPTTHDATTAAIVAFSTELARDPRFTTVHLPVGDGLLLLQQVPSTG